MINQYVDVVELEHRGVRYLILTDDDGDRSLWSPAQASIEMRNYTAKITARGSASHVTGDESAVDAVIYYLGTEVGQATLVKNQLGELDTWGAVHNWADDALQRHMIPQIKMLTEDAEYVADDLIRYFFDLDDLVGCIVNAVREAAR